MRPARASSMRVRITVVLIVLAVTGIGPPASAAAAVEYDSSYAGESAFIRVSSPEQTYQFTVFFMNTGTET
jgi:uridine phosphorylase